MCDVKFPCDNKGQYVNLPTLKRPRNGDLVIINKIEEPGWKTERVNLSNLVGVDQFFINNFFQIFKKIIYDQKLPFLGTPKGEITGNLSMS